MKDGPILHVVRVGLLPAIVLTVTILGIALGLVRWEPPKLWSIEFGSSGLENRVVSLSADGGGLYAGGYVGMSVNNTSSQLFVSRYDVSHRLIWSQGFGNFTDGDEIGAVAGAPDGVYVGGHLGGLNESGFVRKYDLQGHEVWNNRLTSSSNSNLAVEDVSTAITGVYTVESQLNGTYWFFPNATTTMVLRSYDSTGTFLWNETVGRGTGLATPANATVFAGANGLYVSWFPVNGWGYLQRYDFSGNLQWNSRLTCICEPSDVSADGTGVYVAGRSNDGVTAFVAKYDWGGNPLWTRTRSFASGGIAHLSMSVDSSGVYMAFSTYFDGSYLARYDEDGNNVWLFRIPSSPYSLSVSSGGAYVGGDMGRGGHAVLSEYSESPSLIFFELNPPFSFLAVSFLTVAAAINVVWLKKRAERMRQSSSPSIDHRTD